MKKIYCSLNKINTEQDGSNKLAFKLSLVSDDCVAKTSGIEEFELGDFASMHIINPQNMPLKEGEYTLAAVCYSKDGNMGFSNEFFNDIEGNIDDIKKYDLVYLIKCQFKG